jgi:hypothetical protein
VGDLLFKGNFEINDVEKMKIFESQLRYLIFSQLRYVIKSQRLELEYGVFRYVIYLRGCYVVAVL